MSTGELVAGGVAALLLTFGTAFVGTRFPVDEWYAGIAKPAWNPPSWLFAPVWTVLYLLMAISAWLVWKDHGLSAAALPLAVFVVQLVLNATWSWLFFGRHQIGIAAIEILILWAAILLTTGLFWRLEQVAGILFVPYLLWVSFASALNIAIWRLNSRSAIQASGSGKID